LVRATHRLGVSCLTTQAASRRREDGSNSSSSRKQEHQDVLSHVRQHWLTSVCPLLWSFSPRFVASFLYFVLAGFWATFGAKEDLNDQQGIDLAKDCLRVARNAGINLFDNAETYGNPTGEAERIMGVAIAQLREEDPVKWRRSDLIITTKVTSSLLAQLIIRPPLRSFGVVMV
jgi:hypothetical protein